MACYRFNIPLRVLFTILIVCGFVFLVLGLKPVLLRGGVQWASSRCTVEAVFETCGNCTEGSSECPLSVHFVATMRECHGSRVPADTVVVCQPAEDAEAVAREVVSLTECWVKEDCASPNPTPFLLGDPRETRPRVWMVAVAIVMVVTGAVGWFFAIHRYRRWVEDVFDKHFSTLERRKREYMEELCETHPAFHTPGRTKVFAEWSSSSLSTAPYLGDSSRVSVPKPVPVLLGKTPFLEKSPFPPPTEGSCRQGTLDSLASTHLPQRSSWTASTPSPSLSL